MGSEKVDTSTTPTGEGKTDVKAGEETLLDEAGKTKVDGQEESILDEAGKEEKLAKEAEDKRLLEAKDEDLSAEDKVKKQELLKAKEAAEKEAKAKAVPEKYDVKVPEGMTLDQAFLDKVSPVLKELGITQEGAQKLVDVYAPYMKEQVEAITKSINEQQDINFKNFVEERKQETVKVLGTNYKEELAFAAKTRNRFATPELVEKLNLSGLANDIDVIKLFIAVGRAISEGKLVEGKGEIPGEGKSPAEKLYPSATKT